MRGQSTAHRLLDLVVVVVLIAAGLVVVGVAAPAAVAAPGPVAAAGGDRSSLTTVTPTPNRTYERGRTGTGVLPPNVGGPSARLGSAGNIALAARRAH